jgi:hypothetical protein
MMATCISDEMNQGEMGGQDDSSIVATTTSLVLDLNQYRVTMGLIVIILLSSVLGKTVYVVVSF